MNDRVKELLRSQVPYAGSDLLANPFVSFLEGLEARLDGAEALIPRVLSVTLAAASTTLTDPDAEQVTATVVVQAGADDSVTWASSDELVATVDASGLVTTVGAGTTTITATSVFNTEISGSLEFTVE